MGTLTKASQLGQSATLVIGSPSAGKSSAVRDDILENKPEAEVLWVAFNNTEAIVNEDATADWDVAVLGSWADYESTVIKPALAGELKNYDALVLDGGNIMAALALSKIAPSGSVTQADWLKMSELVRNTFIQIRDKVGAVYLIVDVVPNEDGERGIALNRYLSNLLVPLFGRKWYCHTARNKDGKTVDYKVQKNSILALNLEGVKE